MEHDPVHTVALRISDAAFPHMVGVEQSHYEGCWRDHPRCAFFNGVVAALGSAQEPVETLWGLLEELALPRHVRSEAEIERKRDEVLGAFKALSSLRRNVVAGT